MVKKGVPRAPHKEGCLCVICKAKHREVSSPLPELRIILPPSPEPAPEKIEARLDSLPNASKFELGGQQHVVKEGVEGMVVCYNLAINDTVTLGGSTMVKPIK